MSLHLHPQAEVWAWVEQSPVLCKPTFIVPFFGDQRFGAWLGLRSASVLTAPIVIDHLMTDRIMRALKQAL